MPNTWPADFGETGEALAHLEGRAQSDLNQGVWTSPPGFSSALVESHACMCVRAQSLSHTYLTPCHSCPPHPRQVPLSLGFPRQEYWSGLSVLPQGIFLTQGSNPHHLHWQADSLPSSTWKAHACVHVVWEKDIREEGQKWSWGVWSPFQLGRRWTLGMSERRRDFTRIKQTSNVFKCKNIQPLAYYVPKYIMYFGFWWKCTTLWKVPNTKGHTLAALVRLSGEGDR